MKVIVVYDSAYGNTEKVAKVVADILGSTAEVKILPIGYTNLSDLWNAELVIVGSPTHGGRPTAATKLFLDNIPDNTLHGARVAAFDTRMNVQKQGAGLQLLMKTIGFAAPKIAKNLAAKGGKLTGKPAGFIVDGREGPISKDELSRAENWAQGLVGA